MPNTSSAKRALRKSAVRRDRNKAARSELRTILKKAREAAAGNDKSAAESAFRLAKKRLDQAAANGLIHANKAARTKSRLAKHFQSHGVSAT